MGGFSHIYEKVYHGQIDQSRIQSYDELHQAYSSDYRLVGNLDALLFQRLQVCRMISVLQL